MHLIYCSVRSNKLTDCFVVSAMRYLTVQIEQTGLNFRDWHKMAIQGYIIL